MEVNRDNQVLLNKLVEISTGKWSHIKKEKESGANLTGPKSLNVGYRKRETERIERETHAFAKRLFDRQAHLSKQKLEQDYKNHLKYKGQIQKIKGSKKPQKKTQPLVKPGDIASRSRSVDQTKIVAE